MKINTEEIADREVALTLEPEPERVEKAVRRVARKVAKRIKIPGFRPGKAPFQIVERTVGREYLLDEAASEMASELYKEALDKTGLEPYAPADLQILSLDPVSLKVTVALTPEVDLGDYQAIRVEPGDEVVVTDEQVDESLQEVQERLSEWDSVERAVQMGDQIVIDIMGNKGDDVLFDEKEQELILTEDVSPPGFSEQLLGIEPEESKEFSCTYPDDFPDEDLQGQEIAFKVTLHGVREKQAPVLDDELAKSAGDYETLEDLKQALRDGIQQRLEEEARDRLAETAVKALVEQASVTYPAVALKDEVDDMIASYEKRLESQGFTLDSYLNMTGQTSEVLRGEFESGAKERLVRSLVLAELTKAEGIKVEGDEVNEEIARIASTYGDKASVVKRALTQRGATSSIASDLYSRKAIDRLIAIATGQVEAAESGGEQGVQMEEAEALDEESAGEDEEQTAKDTDSGEEESSASAEASAPEDSEDEQSTEAVAREDSEDEQSTEEDDPEDSEDEQNNEATETDS
ncbi:MAG: trigger factor [Anaerolineae bacterium]|nr:trigger factor [Anaerolineae bacterium]